jgi:hypothetical protein
MSDAGTKEEPYEDTPSGWAKRWEVEFASFKKFSEGWRKEAEEAEKRLVDDREAVARPDYKLALFPANVDTLRALLFGNTPRTDVVRRFADFGDDVARVAGEMLERNLNEDDTGNVALAEEAERALDDRLAPGLAVLRVRYNANVKTTEVPPKTKKGPDGADVLDEETGEPVVLAEGYKEESREDEKAEVEYVHWRDFRWSPARVWKEVRWVAFRAEMSRKALVKRFGDAGKLVPLGAKRNADGRAESGGDAQRFNPWQRADVWEVWDKETKRVYWVVEGYSKTLDIQDDPLELDDFLPCPKPWLANPTNARFLPRTDLSLAKDQYDEIDELENRIACLIKAVKVVGGYDASVPALGQMLKKKDGELVAVPNWAMFGEKGGIKGSVDFFPLDMVVAAIDKLTEKQSEQVAKLNQVTGMSDIIRGQAQAGVTATEQSIKARFASVRLKRLQDGFAALVTGAQALRAELICKRYEAPTILARANMANTPEAQMPAKDCPAMMGPNGQPVPATKPDGTPLRSMLDEAVELLKDQHHCYRIEVKPESVALTDYAAIKQERTELMQAFASYMQMMAMPGAGPLMPVAQVVFQWLVAGLKGATSIEGALDSAFAQMQQQRAAAAQQPQRPDPKLQAQQLKGQQDQQQTQLELQADLQRNAAEVQGDVQRQAAQAHFNIMENTARERAKTLAGIDAVLSPQTGGGA